MLLESTLGVVHHKVHDGLGDLHLCAYVSPRTKTVIYLRPHEQDSQASRRACGHGYMKGVGVYNYCRTEGPNFGSVVISCTEHVNPWSGHLQSLQREGIILHM